MTPLVLEETRRFEFTTLGTEIVLVPKMEFESFCTIRTLPLALPIFNFLPAKYHGDTALELYRYPIPQRLASDLFCEILVAVCSEPDEPKHLNLLSKNFSQNVIGKYYQSINPVRIYEQKWRSMTTFHHYKKDKVQGRVGFLMVGGT